VRLPHPGRDRTRQLQGRICDRIDLIQCQNATNIVAQKYLAGTSSPINDVKEERSPTRTPLLGVGGTAPVSALRGEGAVPHGFRMTPTTLPAAVDAKKAVRHAIYLVQALVR